MNQSFRCGKILLPSEKCDLSKWAVIACDQYTSEPDYWKEVDSFVKDSPSTLRLTLPEVYLEDEDVQDRIDKIKGTMQEYMESEVLQELPEGMILVSRDTGACCDRKGLVMAFDLECYDYDSTKASLIRPTEKTIVERIPPRLKVRKDAMLELPHIMILIDDPERTVIEPLFSKTDQLKKVYDVDLMKNGGHIRGWFVPEGELTAEISDAINSLVAKEAFVKRYNLMEDYPLLQFAVGDGNHSMATAKAYWEQIKEGLSEDEKTNHPARFVLAELVNIHDDSLEIEAIYRTLFGVEPKAVLDAAKKYFESFGCQVFFEKKENAMELPWYSETEDGTMYIVNSKWSMPVAALQAFLDNYLEKNPEVRIDYIHGLDTVKEISKRPGNMGFFLPDPSKSGLFSGVIHEGVLPRKTFSMGEAREKRYYMEAKKIR